MTKQDIYEIDAEMRAIIARAQADWDYADKHHTIPSLHTRSEVGSIVNYSQQIDALVAPLLEPVPSPPPNPALRFVAPIANGAVYGRTKWLAGSLGVDMFCKRGTPVVAPADCVIEEVIYGTGIQGGAEVILALPDRSWAWRWRHVYAQVAVGQKVVQGQRCAYVQDVSLDQLGPVPSWAQPVEDQYQHVDLSVAKGTDQFAPTGGGGGNYSAFQFLVDVGYQGRVLARTPGPPDAGYGMEASITLLTPVGR